ncbi:dTDP-3-amino-3,4, 6-trideoxy-alpha-D-glucopyranose [Pelagimonas phthalicica]|uniref:dTDP-3-amino-3,4, 6-trideoxy-alpha-D-glucopyranose n=2 Tax=Pelagimonas phthalicica TaxID=1037362 RepID=A0A238JC80_9RHOB|nr:class I SAM-dependent methyltransferase [Pelagimonas phthalicica]TDS90936.1 2-polyprenyl-3-methyl-5-hydroxy-6-metoxy-1,4-benzoquinol methylase [Pelagimonas phthalicica]SMX27983.1 dTDP-3-amino-3,4, 6-trideoxy-alpha-D-glucopyranose [Pelagimonas phthalicica]
MQSLYDGAAKSWQSGISKLGFDAAYRDLVRFACPEGPRATSVLDAGCGTAALSQAFYEVTGSDAELDLLDLSSDMLTQAHSVFPTARCLQGTVGDTPLGRRYDVILCAHVIEHCDDPIQALRWIFEHLNPNGRLILSVSRPHWCTALVRWRWGHQSYKPTEILDLLNETGFHAPAHEFYRTGPPYRLSCGYCATRL